MEKSFCKVDNCSNVLFAKGFCKSCYNKEYYKIKPYIFKFKKEPCSNCGKLEVKCKNLCNSCYAKNHRNTPHGKLMLKIYNDTKGRENNKKHLEKKFINKTLNPEKKITICECGEKSISKGYCHKCYHKYYQRKKNENKPRKEHIPKTRKKTILDNIKRVGFNDVSLLLERGFTIKNACEKLDLKIKDFYLSISEQEKSNLKEKEINFLKKFKSLTDYEDETFDINEDFDLIKMLSTANKVVNLKNRLKSKKSILQYTLDGVFLCKYESMSEAQISGIDIGSISRICNGFKKPNVFIFKYEDEEKLIKDPLDNLLFFLQ